MQLEAPHRSLVKSFGLERVGYIGIAAPYLALICMALVTAAAALGLWKLKVDDSLSELFRTNTEEFRRFEEIARVEQP